MSKVLYLSSFHPFAQGEMGAGEGIAGCNLKKLLDDGCMVDVIVNAPTYQSGCRELIELCNSYKTINHTGKSALSALFFNFLGFSFLAPWFYTRITSSFVGCVCKTISETTYDYIYVEFPSSLGIVLHLPEHVYVKYFAHDVVSQKISRSPIKKILHLIVKSMESKLLRRVGHVFTLSEKDEVLIRSLSPQCTVSVVDVISHASGHVVDSISVSSVIDAFGDNKNFVFFGNMKRPENYLSVMWFLIFVWHRFTKNNEDAHFWVLGLKPPVILRLMSKILKNIHITGAVDDPVPAFKSATLCIAPILFGAGVKIKVLQMLDAGADVLATPIGAEGVTSCERLIIVNKQNFLNALNEYNKK